MLFDPTSYLKHPIKNVLHIGAHTHEEDPLYKSWGLKDENIIWVDAIEYAPNTVIAVISDQDNEQVQFKVTNNKESSSILELGTHKDAYPHITVTNTIDMITTTISTLIKELATPIPDFWNLDIQGAELKALKGGEKLLKHVNSIYIEVNVNELYTDCARLNEIDDFLFKHGFIRVHLEMTCHQWGDALYIKRFIDRPMQLGNVDDGSERDIWKYLAASGITSCFDIGARDSDMPSYFNKVALFEPNPIEFDKLQTSETVTKHKYGIGLKDDTISYYPNTESFIKRHVHVVSENPIYLDIKTFDMAVADAGFIPEFVKIDTEGYELNVLKSLKNYLSQIKVIQFEVGGTMFDAGFTMNDLFDAIGDGFTIYNIEGDYLVRVPEPIYWGPNERRNSNMLAIANVI